MPEIYDWKREIEKRQREDREFTYHESKGKRLKLISQENKEDTESNSSEIVGGIIDENCNNGTEHVYEENSLIDVIGCVTKENCRQSTNDQLRMIDNCINVISEKTSSTIFLDPSNVPKIELSLVSNKQKPNLSSYGTK